MPFPLAHPAAVLPFRRWCPRWLSLPALIIGSLSPDVGYCFGPLALQRVSHRFWGGIEFCLPVGLLILWVFRHTRCALVRTLPARWQEVLLPLCERPLGSPFVLAVSVLIGAWTHIGLDALVHENGWAAQQVPWLNSPVVWFGGHAVRVTDLLAGGCTFGGVLWLSVVLQDWLREATHLPPLRRPSVRWRRPVLLALGVLLLDAVHYLVPDAVEMPLLWGLMLATAIGVAWQLGSLRRRR